MQRVVLPGGELTWTVLGADHRPVGPAEEYLEFLRAQAVSPNTVKSYARGLALWWQYLAAFGLSWDRLTLADVGGFLSWLRSGDGPGVVSIQPRRARFAESTIAVRLRAVMSCYDFHQLNGVGLGGDLPRLVHRRGAGYRPLLEHVARRRGRREAVVRVRGARRAAPPTLTPGQIELICGACAVWDADAREWRGSVRDRLLWALLAESGMRLGEVLGLQHRDWHTGRGDTPFVEVVPRDHPHRVRVKDGGYRRLYVSDELDRLYGEHLWRLCEAGIDAAVADLDAAPVFVNLAHAPRFAPWRPESVYDPGGPVAPRVVGAGAGGLVAALVPPFPRHGVAVVRGSGACGEPAAWPRGRADDAEPVRACDPGRGDAGGRAVEGVHRRVADRGGRGRSDRAVLVSGTRLDTRSAGAGTAVGYRPAVLQALWNAVPAGMRLTYVDVDAVPEEYRGGLGQRRGRAAGIDLSALPAPIRRELAWCLFRIIEQGGKVDVTHTRMLARRLGEAIADLGPSAPDSLTVLSTREWCQQISLAVQRRTGSLPAPGTARPPANSSGAAIGCLPRPTTRAPGGSARYGIRTWTRGFRNARTSRGAATPPTSTGSQPRGCAAACSGTAR